MTPVSPRIELQCVHTDVDAVGLAAVNELVGRGVLASVWYGDQTDSTNTTALRQVRDREPRAIDTPRLVLVDRQTAGRGRMGRTWVSDESSLTFSLVIDFRVGDDDRSRWLSLAVGLAIAKTLESLFPAHPASLKWPNDVYFGGGKVAGVLLETIASVDIMVIGVGVNVASRPDLSDATAAPVGCIADVVGQTVERYEILDPLIARIVATLDELRGDASALVHQYRRRCWLTGHHVSFRDSKNMPRQGVCVGVQAGGTLAVTTQTGQTMELQSGEVHRVRVEGGSRRVPEVRD